MSDDTPRGNATDGERPAAPHGAGAGGVGTTQAATAGRAVFVGRAPQLAALATQIELARGGSPRVILIEGPAGMGKTALVHRALGAAPDFRVVSSSGDEWESRIAGGVVSQLMAGIERVQGLRGAATSEAVQDPYATGAWFLERLGRFQDQGPLALVVDDVQWADTLSVQAIAFVVRRLHADHVVAIFTARDDPPGAPETLRRLAEGDRGVSLRLKGLDASEMAELGAAVTGDPLSRRAAERLSAHTGGNPLHARALLEEIGSGLLEDPGEILPAPSSFALVVVARVGACSPKAAHLVQAAAVLGQRCQLGAAAAVGGVNEPAGALDEAVAARLLVPARNGEVAFSHPLVRAAVYHHLGSARRSALHARAAAVLTGPAALCHRIEAALVEDPPLAAEVEAHAREELARGAMRSAADFFLAAARLSVDGGAKETLVLDALGASLAAGEITLAKKVAERVATFADSARRRYLLGHLALASGRQEEAEALLAGAWDLSDPCDQGELKSLIAGDMAQVCQMQLRSVEAADWTRRAIEVSVDPELTTSALSVLVPCLGRVGRPAHAVAAAEPVPKEHVDATVVTVEALLGRAIVRLWVDDLSQARADLTAVVAACRHRPASRQSLVALGMLADTEYRLGEWDESVAHGARLVSLVEDTEQVWFGAFAHTAASWALAPRGDFERAERHAGAAAAAGQVLADATSVGCAATAAAHAAFFRGDLERAAQAVEPIVARAPRADEDELSIHPWRELYVETLLGLKRLEEAEAVLTALEALGASRGRRSSSAHAARLRGELEARRGCHDAARPAFEAAVAGAQELDLPFDQARAENAYGSYLRRVGERRAAATYLRAAYERFVALRAHPLADRCQRELAACGLTPVRRSVARHLELTPQELAVARLVVAGKTNREVAAELVVSAKTVGYHLGNIYTKLGVSSRTQLAARFAATGT